MVHEGLRECGRRRRLHKALPRGVEGEEQRMKAGWIHPPSSSDLTFIGRSSCTWRMCRIWMIVVKKD